VALTGHGVVAAVFLSPLRRDLRTRWPWLGATLAAVLGAGGLGRLIIDGIAQQDDAQLFMGAVLVGLLAIGTELGFALLQRRLVSPGQRRGALPSGDATTTLERPGA